MSGAGAAPQHVAPASGQTAPASGQAPSASNQAIPASNQTAPFTKTQFPSKLKRGATGLLKGVLRLALIVVVALGVALGLRFFVVQAYTVPTASMSDTIEEGDCVFAEKISYYTGEPQVGDIVAFTAYAEFTDATEDIFGNVTSGTLQSETIAFSEDDVKAVNGGTVYQTTLVKRVIATEGQTVTIRDGKVYVDGELLEESYVDDAETTVSAGTGIADTYLDEKGVFTYEVQEGEVFVLGDNRANSYDSRYFGAVKTSDITGRVVACYWPLSRLGTLK